MERNNNGSKYSSGSSSSRHSSTSRTSEKSNCSRCNTWEMKNRQLTAENDRWKSQMKKLVDDAENYRTNPSKFRMIVCDMRELIQGRDVKRETTMDRKSETQWSEDDDEDDGRPKGVVTSHLRRPHKFVYAKKTERENYNNYHPYGGGGSRQNRRK